jgi:hypothetical protein
MSVASLVLSMALSAAPAQSRFSFEPVVLGAAGLVAVTFGTVALLRADATYATLQQVRTDDVMTAGQARERVERAAQLRSLGVTETNLGTALVSTGTAFVAAAVVWFLIEGPQTVVVTVVPARETLSFGASVRF